MRIVLQRVSRARVSVGGDVVGEIGAGLLALVGIEDSDTAADVEAAADKISGMRVFPDEDDRMNLAATAVGAEVLVVSQFTLLADLRKGRRPAFTAAGDPSHAREMVSGLARALRDRGLATATGRFGERMTVELSNDGPVTLIMEVKDGRVS